MTYHEQVVHVIISKIDGVIAIFAHYYHILCVVARTIKNLVKSKYTKDELDPSLETDIELYEILSQKQRASYLNILAKRRKYVHDTYMNDDHSGWGC